MRLAPRTARRHSGFAAPFVTCATGALLAAGAACAHAPAAPSTEESFARAPAASSSVAPRVCARHAAPWGRDSNPGTKRQPYKTVQRLADRLRPGETGCLRGGRYDQISDGYVLDFDRGGRSGSRLVIRSYPGERATLVGTIQIPREAPYVTLAGLRILGTGDGNTLKIYSANAVIKGNRITNRGLGESCMILGSTSDYGRAIRTVVRGNRFFRCGDADNDNKDHAVYVSSSVGVRIVGNVFWQTAGYTIHFYPNARGSYVGRNVIDGGAPSVRGGVLFGGNDEYASSGNVVERNVIAYARSSNITSGWDVQVGSGNIARRNCVWGARDRDIDVSDAGFVTRANVVARPRFVNRAGRDYRLRKGSRCRGVVGFSAVARVAALGR